MMPDATTKSRRAEEGLAEAHAGLAASFAAAAEGVGGVSVDRISMAGASVALTSASPALRQRLVPALAHLSETGRDEREPALTIYLWDSASTGAPPPPRPQVPRTHAPGALYHSHEPPRRAVYQPGLETLSVLDIGNGTAWHWVADAYEQPYWDQACPMRQILSWWLGSRGTRRRRRHTGSRSSRRRQRWVRQIDSRPRKSRLGAVVCRRRLCRSRT
jgi:hypothetical protein